MHFKYNSFTCTCYMLISINFSGFFFLNHGIPVLLTCGQWSYPYKMLLEITPQWTFNSVNQLNKIQENWLSTNIDEAADLSIL